MHERSLQLLALVDARHGVEWARFALAKAEAAGESTGLINTLRDRLEEAIVRETECRALWEGSARRL